ncbi:MAG TPA: DALR anticodon-binding domain-containing protein, partial [Victivallales bacterium]|nr:DALR anticodon-binding domain-containing protein [Victivallales bacterium]
KCDENKISFDMESANFAKLSSKEERELSVRTVLYHSALCQAVDKLDSSIISSYLLDLAKCFSRFYREHSVMNADDEEIRNARLKLAITVRDILKDGLSILGIEIPEAM